LTIYISGSTRTLDAGRILGEDPGFLSQVKDAKDKLPPFAIGKAARVLLERRLSFGGGQTGWSRAWVVNFWDHLDDGKQAYGSLQVMIRQSTFPKLMDTHPPGLFQIDGNLGAANGMLEALVQSRWTPETIQVELLPAVPAQWAEGSVKGLRVRGGAAVNMRWKDGKIVSL
jgi:alpha-L-fucosidase 2